MSALKEGQMPEKHEACSATKCAHDEAVPERCPKFDLYDYRLATDQTDVLDTEED